ncbi:MAG TPA: hypothetical protein VD969_07810 [Symbiobacteriaceae bacterium]|nr:hypothetical protein [Symbiobacteriaceae bacterium]
MTRQMRTALMIAGLLLFGAAAVWVNLPSFERISLKVGDFDIIGMLKEVDKTNTAILKANNELIASLEGVRQQAGAVSGVHARMQQLEAGLGEQARVLGRLDGITREQADLSVALRKLTAGVGPSTGRLAATASQQAVAVESMKGTTAGMAQRMQTIGALNASIRAKLWTAERLSGEVLDLLPP